jgi:biopolymer transport protein ExbB/TolQ
MIVWFFIAIAGWTVAVLLFALCIALCLQDTSARRAKRRLVAERDRLAEELSYARDNLAGCEKFDNDLQRIRRESLQRLDAIERARDQSYCEDMEEMVDGLPDPHQ